MTSKLRKAARGKECTLQIFPYCNQNPETVVLCHLNSEKKGWGIKSPDFFAVIGCSDCHDVIDGRKNTDIDPVEIERCKQRALFRTWVEWENEGLIKIA